MALLLLLLLLQVVLFYDGPKSEDYDNALEVIKETEKVGNWALFSSSLFATTLFPPPIKEKRRYWMIFIEF